MATRRRFIRREHPAVVARNTRAWLSAATPASGPQRERFERDFQESNLPPLPVKRGPRLDHDDLEKHVLAAVGDLLAVHPQVLLAVRQNSGSLPYDREGRPVPIFFYKLVRVPEEEITLVDYWGFLRSGHPFAIECKRPSWKRSASDEREKKQDAFLQMIAGLGGKSGFARSADEAQAVLA